MSYSIVYPPVPFQMKMLSQLQTEKSSVRFGRGDLSSLAHSSHTGPFLVIRVMSIMTLFFSLVQDPVKNHALPSVVMST